MPWSVHLPHQNFTCYIQLHFLHIWIHDVRNRIQALLGKSTVPRVRLDPIHAQKRSLATSKLHLPHSTPLATYMNPPDEKKQNTSYGRDMYCTSVSDIIFYSQETFTCHIQFHLPHPTTLATYMNHPDVRNRIQAMVGTCTVPLCRTLSSIAKKRSLATSNSTCHITLHLLHPRLINNIVEICSTDIK